MISSTTADGAEHALQAARLAGEVDGLARWTGPLTERRSTIDAQAARAGIERWRTRASNPLNDPLTTEACEAMARPYEAQHVATTSDPARVTSDETTNRWDDRFPVASANRRERMATSPHEKPARPTKKKAATKSTAARTATRKKASSTKPPEKPVLLAGGNPQIPKGEGDGPVQAYLAAMPGWKRDVGRRLDELIVRAVPDVHKAVKWNSPFYGIEGEGWFLNFHCYDKYVKVAFFRGTSLTPVPPGESRSQDTRYLDVREGELDEERFTDWVKQARELPGEHI